MRRIYVFYLDVFVVNNFLFNICISVFTFQISKIQIKPKLITIILASVGEAIISVFILAYVHRYFVYMIWSFLFGIPILAIVSVSYQNKKLMQLFLMNMYIVAVVLAGTILVIQNLVENRINYTIILVISFVVAEITIKIISFCKKKNQLLYEVVVYYKEKCFRTMALYDSGNRLRYQALDKGVHIVTEEIIRKLGINKENIQIEYKALGTTNGLIDLYKVDKIEIIIGRKIFKETNVFFGKADKDLLEGKEYQMILNGDIFL